MALAVAGLVCLVLGEVAARVYFDQTSKGGREPSLEGTVGEYDELLGARLLPNATATFGGPEFETTIRTNAHRLRESEETPYERTPGVRRILLCGDSFTFGHGVDEADRYGERLAELLGNVDVINMGVWGTGTDQQLLLYRDEGVKYGPDLVILAYFVENILRNGASTRFIAGGRSASKPKFVIENGELVLTNVPVPAPGTATEESTAEMERWKEIEERQGVVSFPFKSFLREHSALYKFAHDNFAGLLHRAVEGEVDAYPEYVDGRSEWEVTKALIRTFRDEAEENGSEFLLVIVPDGRSMEPGTISDTPYQKLEQLCRAESIPLLDPLPEFRAASEQGEKLYYRYDAHWTKAGHALVADLIAGRLRAEGW